MTENLELRMYFFVPYNLSSIQKGIQAGHAALEYALRYGRTELFKTFMRDYKTWIILNGGTTRDVGISMENGIEAGTLNQIRLGLESNNIFHSFFREPDLNYALTAVCFIADERVWNFERPICCEFVAMPDAFLELNYANNHSFPLPSNLSKNYHPALNHRDTFQNSILVRRQ